MSYFLKHIYKECRLKNPKIPIGVAKVEYDDESSAQMLYIYK